MLVVGEMRVKRRGGVAPTRPAGGCAAGRYPVPLEAFIVGSFDFTVDGLLFRSVLRANTPA